MWKLNNDTKNCIQKPEIINISFLYKYLFQAFYQMIFISVSRNGDSFFRNYFKRFPDNVQAKFEQSSPIKQISKKLQALQGLRCVETDRTFSSSDILGCVISGAILIQFIDRPGPLHPSSPSNFRITGGNLHRPKIISLSFAKVERL